MRCPNCGAWSARYHIRRCSECGAELVPVPDYRGRAIAAAVLCTFFGVVALYFSVQTHRALAAGDYPGARRASELARSWANAGLWLALAGLLFFGTILLLEAMGPS